MSLMEVWEVIIESVGIRAGALGEMSKTNSRSGDDYSVLKSIDNGARS